jgi:hypothetical protein
MTTDQTCQSTPPLACPPAVGSEIDTLICGLERNRRTGAPLPPPFDAIDFDEDPDREWRTAADDSSENLMALWESSVERSRANVAAVCAEGPEARSNVPWMVGEPPALRRLMVDMIEEYARHIGQADLMRESIDGRVGEGAPQSI